MKIIISLVSFVFIIFVIKKVINVINRKNVPSTNNNVNIKSYNVTNSETFKPSDVLSETDLKIIISQLDNLSQKLSKKEN